MAIFKSTDDNINVSYLWLEKPHVKGQEDKQADSDRR